MAVRELRPPARAGRSRGHDRPAVYAQSPLAYPNGDLQRCLYCSRHAAPRRGPSAPARSQAAPGHPGSAIPGLASGAPQAFLAVPVPRPRWHAWSRPTWTVEPRNREARIRLCRVRYCFLGCQGRGWMPSIGDSRAVSWSGAGRPGGACTDPPRLTTPSQATGA